MVAISTTSTRRRRSSPGPDLPVTLAKHRSQDCYFDIKLTQLEATTWHSQPAHQLHFKVDLARPFDIAKRIRSATISITIHRSHKSRPKIVGIDPEASLVKIADHEITSGQNIGLSGGTHPAAPGMVTASANATWGAKTTYEGNRLIHGFLPTDTEAQWKMYEEPRSKSGLPPSLELLMIVTSDDDFWVSAEMSVSRWGGWCGVGMVQSIHAPIPDQEQKLCRIPSIASGGLRTGWHKMSDDIAACLRESEQKLESLEKVMKREFPDLEREKIYGGCGAVLSLDSTNRAMDSKQINVPFYPNVRWIGRAGGPNRAVTKDNNGFFESRLLSERHAQVWARKDGTVWIRDNNSTHGTFINGEQLLPGANYRLRQEDSLQFGETIHARQKNGKQTVVQEAVRMNVEFVGLPGTSPDGNLKLELVEPDYRTAPEDMPAAKAESARKNVETKFKNWREMATGAEQLQQLTILENLTKDRLRTLGVPQERLRIRRSDNANIRERIHSNRTYGRYEDDDDDDDDSDDSEEYRRESYEIRNSRSRSRRRASHVPSPMTGGELFGGRAMTGEQALRNHRTVGGGWNERKL